MKINVQHILTKHGHTSNPQQVNMVCSRLASSQSRIVICQYRQHDLYVEPDCKTELDPLFEHRQVTVVDCVHVLDSSRQKIREWCAVSIP